MGMGVGWGTKTDEVVPIAFGRGKRLARRAVEFARDDMFSLSDAADRLVTLSAGDEGALSHALAHTEAISQIPKSEKSWPVIERAAAALRLAGQRIAQHSKGWL